MNTKRFSLLVIVILAIMVAGLGCSKKMSNPMEPQEQNTDPSIPDFTGAAVGTNPNYLNFIPLKETLIPGRSIVVEVYFKKSAIPCAEDYPQITGDFTGWNKEYMKPVINDWYMEEIFLGPEVTYNLNFYSKDTTGKRVSMSWERMKEVAGSFAFWDEETEKRTDLPDGFYGGDIRLHVTTSGDIIPVPGSGKPPWERGGGMSMSIHVEGLPKSTSTGELSIDNNLGIVNNIRIQKAWPITAQIPVAVYTGGNIAVGDGLYNKEFEVDIYVDGMKRYTFAPKYNANVPGRGVSCVINLRLNGQMDQEGTFPIETLHEFKYCDVLKAQDDNSRWNTTREAYPVLPTGSEWVVLNGQERSIWLARQMADGSNPCGQIGVPETEVSKGSITDPTGKTYKFSQLTISDWFPGHKLVKFFYDRNTGAITGAKPLVTSTRTVHFLEDVSWQYTIWPEDKGPTGVTLNPGQYYPITLTAQEPDTVWFSVKVANNDGLRVVKVKYESTVGSGNFNQTMALGRFDYNPSDKNTSIAWIGLVSNGNVVTKGKYTPIHILGP